MVPVEAQAPQKVAAPVLAEQMLVLAAPALQAQRAEDWSLVQAPEAG